MGSIYTGLLKNVIAHYNINGSPIYGCFLDASKAFDRAILFDKLLKRNLSLVITRTLLNWYSDQRMCVSWISGKLSSLMVCVRVE